MHTTRGFTIVELMIGLVVIGVLAFIGLPEFRNMLANTQIRTAGEAITNGLQTARGEAVQRNATIVFALGSQSAYQVIVAGTGEVLRNRSAQEGSRAAVIAVTPAGATQVAFGSLGRVVTNPDATPSIQKIDLSTAAVATTESRPLRVEVSNNVRMCDPHVLTAGDPRLCLLP